MTALTASGATAAAPKPVEPLAAKIFARFDCYGRLAHTQITEVGEIRSKRRTFTIYNLWFVDPQSRHGMKRLAIIEGAVFRGSYIISSWATPIYREGQIKFVCEKGAICEGENFAIANGKLPRRLWVDGEVNALEDTI